MILTLKQAGSMKIQVENEEEKDEEGNLWTRKAGLLWDGETLSCNQAFKHQNVKQHYWFFILI